MTATPEAMRARRYLLGQASDEECAVLEQEYFERDDAVDRISAAEDDLIEDYLSNDLGSSERDWFERTYLSVPHHRVRVDMIRRLMAQASRSGSAQPAPVAAPSWNRVARPAPWLAMAATLLIAAAVGWWMLSPFGAPQPQIAANPPSPSTPAAPERTPSAPRTFALTIAPVAVRSGAGSPAVVIPAGTEVVVIRLESDADARRLTARRAAIRTVAGVAVWQGPVTADGHAPAVAARLDVPVASLPADDYLVTLYGTNPSGVEQEWNQYYLRVRVR
jgi:hypothetical protein